MSRVQKLRVFVSQRLNAAVEEILAAFEKTIVTYEQEAALCQEVISRQHALLCALHKPLMEVPSADAFTQQLMMKTGEVRPDQEDLIQEQEDLQPSHVKVEQEGEQLQDLDEADIIEFTYNPRCSVRPNEDRSADGTAQVEPGSAGPDHEQLVVSSETEDSEDYSKDSAGPRSASVKLKRKRTGRARGLFSCRVCSRKFKARRLLFRHVKAHLQEAEQVCGVCGERFKTSDSLNLHIQTHRTTRNTSELENRTRTLSREKGVHQISNCNTNAKIHEDQKLNRCDDCGKTFLQVWKKKKHRCRPRNQNQDPENLERPKKMRQT